VDCVEIHAWQGLLGLAVPAAISFPPITHFDKHAPLEQTSPVAHPVPSGLFDHDVVEFKGEHN